MGPATESGMLAKLSASGRTRTTAEPMKGPQNEARPPMIVIERISTERSSVNSAGLM